MQYLAHGDGFYFTAFSAGDGLAPRRPAGTTPRKRHSRLEKCREIGRRLAIVFDNNFRAAGLQAGTSLYEGHDHLRSRARADDFIWRCLIAAA